TLGAKASIAAKISITGAYDDAAACLLGGLVFTDNKNMRLLRRTAMPEEYAVVILPGTFTVPTCSFPQERLDAKAS
ncbi:MAG: hypothetical protein Q4Q04_04610, partial [Methanocorpusculum sp.]|nr:hypothetical protein [Methanocorpusculum sp.]